MKNTSLPSLQLLEIAGLVVDLAVDRDGGFRFEMLAETGIQPVQCLDHVAQAFRLDLEFAHAAGIAAAEAARQHHPRGHASAPP